MEETRANWPQFSVQAYSLLAFGSPDEKSDLARLPGPWGGKPMASNFLMKRGSRKKTQIGSKTGDHVANHSIQIKSDTLPTPIPWRTSPLDSLRAAQPGIGRDRDRSMST
jgi:hypothetical protein